MGDIAIPAGFEQIEHHDHLSVTDGDGTIISLHKIEGAEGLAGKYPWKVIGSTFQKTFFEGSFEERDSGRKKVVELAADR